MFDDSSQEGVSGPGTVVGANVKLTGTISDVNDITIHGSVEGEVVSDKTITIAETAAVKGPVTAQMVSVSGKVNGSITGHQKLELLPTANVNGGITTKELIIKSGASFNGKCNMASDDKDKGGPIVAKKDTPKELAKKEDKKEPESSAPVKKEPEPVKTSSSASGPTFELED